MTEPQPPMAIFRFPATGIWVQAPENLNVTIEPVVLFPPDMSTQDNIHPLRFIGNLKFRDPDDPSKTEFYFDPPVLLQVRFTARDLERVEKRGKFEDALALAWWDTDHWVLPESIEGRIVDERASTGGFRLFVIKRITDPAIIWGT